MHKLNLATVRDRASDYVPEICRLTHVVFATVLMYYAPPFLEHMEGSDHYESLFNLAFRLGAVVIFFIGFLPMVSRRIRVQSRVLLTAVMFAYLIALLLIEMSAIGTPPLLVVQAMGYIAAALGCAALLEWVMSEPSIGLPQPGLSTAIGAKLSRPRTREDARRSAVHEAGHALCLAAGNPHPVYAHAAIFQTPQNSSLGRVTWSRDSNSLDLTSHLHFEMLFYLAGEAAERLLLGDTSTGNPLDLVTVWVEGVPRFITDITLRMLQPRELFLAQGFPKTYIFDRGHDGRPITKTQQVSLVGNSVSPGPMCALARAHDPWKAHQARELESAA